MSLYSSFVRPVVRNRVTSKCYHEMYRSYKSLLYRISPVLLAKHRYKAVFGRLPDLENPESFDEKLLWLMLYWRHPLKTQCGDKYEMRSYVEQLGYENVLPRLIGLYNRSCEIDFESLPERFALKCTHGCGFNIVCQDKAKLDYNAARKKLDQWLATDMSKKAGEVHYSQMKPRIICEEFLDDASGSLPTDYKVYCFGGKAHCTLVCEGRGEAGEHPVFNFFDRNWTKVAYSKSSLLDSRHVPQPLGYEAMIRTAEALSKPFPFVRMDFYDIGGRVVLGEMTFTPAGCVDSDNTDLAQRELGGLITLPPAISVVN